MTPKSGQAPSLVAPAAPKEAVDADNADPGEVAKAKAEQLQTKSGKYGEQKAPTFQGSESDEKKSWIEIQMLDETDKPVPSVRYEIKLPDGSVAGGTLDQNGKARVEGFDPGTCQVSFPELDAEAWEKI